MTLALLWYNPFWRRLHLNGPWTVWVRLPGGQTWSSFMPTFRVAWFHLLVSWGLRDYEDFMGVTVSTSGKYTATLTGSKWEKEQQ